jgi:hypothetical protein
MDPLCISVENLVTDLLSLPVRAVWKGVSFLLTELEFQKTNITTKTATTTPPTTADNIIHQVLRLELELAQEFSETEKAEESKVLPLEFF